MLVRQYRRRKMRKHPLSRLPLSQRMIVSALLLLGNGLFGQEQNTNWDSIEKAARTYIEYPSTNNARLFLLFLPELPLGRNIDTDRFNRLFAYVFNNLEVLARQVSVGDRDAVKLGFRLYDFSDGLFTMRLDCIMGDLVRSHPQLFLEELGSAPNAQELKKLGYPLCESSLSFGGKREMAHRYELEMRIKALRSVTDNALADLRDTCIKEISEFLAKYFHDSPIIVLGEKEYLALFKKAAINVYNESEMANQVCQRVIELEDASNTSSFGAISAKIIHSSGVFDELTEANRKLRSMLDALGNPPLAYKDEYSALREMLSPTNLLFSLATDPSIISPRETADDVKKSTYKTATARYYNRFKDAYTKLVTLMPEISQEVQKNPVNLEAIKNRLK